MKRGHIFLKLSVIISAFLILFIGAVLLFQIRYYGTYYTNAKRAQFAAALAEVSTIFNNWEDSKETLYGQFKIIYGDFGCVAALYPVNDNVSEDNIKEVLDSGIMLDEWTDIAVIPSREIMQYMRDPALQNGPMIKTIRQNEGRLKYLAGLQTIHMEGDPYVLSLVTSLQSVDEAMGTLSEISWLAYLAAVLFALILSAVIARLVTKPLIREIERKKQLDEMRKDFIANASHEMKTPISLISAYAESMIDNILSPEERAECEKAIYDESQKMGRLVRGMLDVALMQNEKNTPQKAELQLDKLTAAAVARLSKPMQAKSLAVDTGGLNPITVLADECMIESALVNLLMNAISHTKERGKITVRLNERGPAARFEIENEGTPIPEEALPHIWESFYRVDKARNRADGRFGLGLFQVKTAIEKHSGTVGVENKPGSVVFHFEIPNS